MISFIKRGGQYAELTKILEKEKLLSKDQINDALQTAKRENRSVVEALFDSGTNSPGKLLKTIAGYYKIPAVELDKKVISPYVINLIPKEVAEKQEVIVFKKVEKVIHVAVSNPEDRQIIDFVRKKTGLEPKIYLTKPTDIELALKRYQGDIGEEFAKIIAGSTKEALALHDTAEKMAQYLPIIRMVESIIDQALNKNASDIHIEPRNDKVVVRFRIDGLLDQAVQLPKEILPSLVTRIKIMANLKIDEHRLPQDGRFKYNYKNQEMAIRVSAVPSLYGTKVVLRLLSMKERQFTLKRLGLNNLDYQTLRQEITKPHGMILVTGPTGSGKTTTLYTLLRLLNKEEVNISTIEDPIEYGIEGITQTQINPPAGLTFSSGLRSFLRQDPDVLMVGEIRDKETAEMSVNAAMTGHLLLSTLHTQ
ncbi:MAG: GspE/PulE family protein [Patescibacteria group bacterium]